MASSANETGVVQALELEAQAFAYDHQWNRDSKKRAIELFLESAEVWSRTGESRKCSDTIRAAASVAVELRDFVTARSLLNRTLDIERTEKYVEGEIISLSLLSELQLRAGDTDDASRTVVRLNEIKLPAAHAEADAARSFANAGWQYWKFDLPETIHHATKARDLWTQTGNTAKLIEANSLIAYCRGALYEPIEAERLVNESLDLATRTGNDRAKAMLLVQKSVVALLTNEPIKALNMYQEAERMFPADLDLSEQAQLANGIGGIYSMLGDWKISNAYTLKAYELFGRDRYEKGQLATLVSLVDLGFALGDPVRGFAYHREAEALSKKLGNDYFISIADRFVANHHLIAGDIDTAILYYEQSLKRLTDSGFKSGISAIRSNLGEAFLRKGDLKSAREHFTAAHEINSSVSDSFAEAQSLFDLARLSKAEGNRAAAGELADQSIALTEQLRHKVLNQKLRSEYFATALERYRFAIEGLVREGKAVESIRVAERSRARETLETLSTVHAEAFADADEATVERERSVRIKLNAKADKLTGALQRGSDETEIREIEREISDLQIQLEQIKADLKQKSPMYSAIKDPPEFDLADFQTNVLDEDSVLLEYLLGKDESYLWFVGKKDFRVFILPGRDVIEGMVDRLHTIVNARKPVDGEAFEQMRNRVAAADADYPKAARELSEIILGPVSTEIQGKRLIIVPDGKLHYFALSALPHPTSTSDEPLVVSNDVVYQPSAQTLSVTRRMASNTRPKPERTRDLLVFSDPVFSRDDGRLAGIENARLSPSPNGRLSLRYVETLDGLQRLSASGHEAQTIAGIIGASNTDHFTGFDATRARLLAANVSHYKIIHLATHGLVNQDRPELSAVVLSRFDETGHPIDESVRLQDIYAMKLNADLVVLSACQTAAGKEIKGEGVMSLNNAFLQAGARSVVASLWQVEDNATNILMREFYRHMAQGESVSSALRKAQITLYRDPQFRSPFYWAAFTVQGNFSERPSIGRAYSMWWIAAAAVTAAGILTLGLFVRRRKGGLATTRR